MSDLIEEIAEKARKIIAQIPFAKSENIDFSTLAVGCTSVYYEARSDGFYQIVKERGDTREYKVANTEDDLVDYFVERAIWSYAGEYELAHRRKFEHSLRQRHEVMEKCYQYIDPDKRFVQDAYDDEVHIYLDLFDAYIDILLDYKQKFPRKYAVVKEDIDFIVERKYVDSPPGGMKDVEKSMALVRERIVRLKQHDESLRNAFDAYEKYYALLENKQ